MQSDYVYPALGDRKTSQEWVDSPDKDLLQRARQRTAEMLTCHCRTTLPRDVDAAIRASFPIRLNPIYD